LALSPGPFFRVLVRWASAFLTGFDRFCIAFDRILTLSDTPLSGFDHLILYTLVYPIGIVRFPAVFSGVPKNRRDDYRVGKIGGLGKVVPAGIFSQGQPDKPPKTSLFPFSPKGWDVTAHGQRPG
jgi:hypothetical protein